MLVLKITHIFWKRWLFIDSFLNDLLLIKGIQLWNAATKAMVEVEQSLVVLVVIFHGVIIEKNLDRVTLQNVLAAWGIWLEADQVLVEFLRLALDNWLDSLGYFLIGFLVFLDISFDFGHLYLQPIYIWRLNLLVKLQAAFK